LRVRNANGSRLYYQEFIGLPVPLRWRLREAINYCRFSFHAGLALREILRDAGPRLLVLVAVPFGWLAYGRDRRIIARRRTAPAK
jgi:hypothetical protein